MTGILGAMLGGKTTLPLSVVASNVSRTEFGGGPTSGTVITVALPNTAITGGVAPYTQAWTQVSGDSPAISDANALNPTWSDTVSLGFPNVSTWRITIADATSATASFDITVTLRWE